MTGGGTPAVVPVYIYMRLYVLRSTWFGFTVFKTVFCAACEYEINGGARQSCELGKQMEAHTCR